MLLHGAGGGGGVAGIQVAFNRCTPSEQLYVKTRLEKPLTKVYLQVAATFVIAYVPAVTVMGRRQGQTKVFEKVRRTPLSGRSQQMGVQQIAGKWIARQPSATVPQGLIVRQPLTFDFLQVIVTSAVQLTERLHKHTC